MSIHKDLSVAYHQQDTDYYCGAACAQMVLDSIGTGLLDQDNLYADNHSHSTTESGWYTAPDGLQWTLNNRRPPGFGNYFALFALANEDTISRKICWTIHHYQVAPIAMVFGWAHWIVVRGYDASDAPGSSGDTSYSINAFDVNNPWPPVPTSPPLPPPPPHNMGDGCGIGGTRGIANEHISYTTWQADYMTGIPSGYWAGKFVAVCDPENPAKSIGQAPPPRDRLPGDRLLDPGEATERAILGLREFGLYEKKSWENALRETHPGKPVLVQRLDRLDSFYYIVPMGADQRQVSVAVSVDARFGDYRQAVALPEQGENILIDQDREAVLARVIDRKIELGDRLGRFVVRPEAFCLYPTLVWKPCRESLSPFYPFHMFTIGAHHVYVRIDGQVFTELHDSERGI
jgi:hypothetical protein